MSTNTRRLPTAAIIAIAVAGAVVLAGVLAVGLTVAGILSFGTAATAPGTPGARDRAHQAADPAGGNACNRLDMWLAGRIGSFADAQAVGAESATAPQRC